MLHGAAWLRHQRQGCWAQQVALGLLGSWARVPSGASASRARREGSSSSASSASALVIVLGHRGDQAARLQRLAVRLAELEHPDADHRQPTLVRLLHDLVCVGRGHVGYALDEDLGDVLSPVNVVVEEQQLVLLAALGVRLLRGVGSGGRKVWYFDGRLGDLHPDSRGAHGGGSSRKSRDRRWPSDERRRRTHAEANAEKP
mmetsp:Transcript_3330/g.8310  ORF Transcript_3330/g.8310 Transcript_3330/m.8310 type:complete len:201 (-) Transcript_3330:44-646(-)